VAGEPEDFLKKFQKELATKKVALFVSSGAQAIIEHEGNPEEIGMAKRSIFKKKPQNITCNLWL
jgi:hypothetical protein